MPEYWYIDPQALFVSKPLIFSIAVVTLSENFWTLYRNNGFRWLQLSSESKISYVTILRAGSVSCWTDTKRKDQSILSKGMIESIRGVGLVHAQIMFYWTTILLLSFVIILEIETEFFFLAISAFFNFAGDSLSFSARAELFTRHNWVVFPMVAFMIHFLVSSFHLVKKCVQI